MSTAIKCQSKNPSACRFHAPNAGKKALEAFETAKRDLRFAEARIESPVAAPTEQDYINVQEAKWTLQNAEDLYYGTPDGLQELTNKLNNVEEGSSEYYDLKFRRDLAEAQVAENEIKMNHDARFGGALVPEGKSSYKLPPTTIEGDSLWPLSTGGKYSPDLSIRQIATSMSADFKQAQKEGYLPAHLKFKVSPNTAHSRIKVDILGADDSQIWEDNSNGYATSFTKDAYELKNRCELLVQAYQRKQYDTIEGRTNFTNYWGLVGFEDNYAKTRRLEKEEASRAKRLAK